MSVTVHQSRRRRERRLVIATVACIAVFAVAVVAIVSGPAIWAYWRYQPQEGDIIFQSLPRSRFVDALEGVTESPLSHCGLVARREGAWIVYEAYDEVEATPLAEFIFRGRGKRFLVCRPKTEYQRFVPQAIDTAAAWLGRPYDVRCRWDDERFYCSELIYKAFHLASDGEQLGPLVRLGDMNWEPYRATIEYYEEGPPPLDRKMITPRDLARASQLVPAYAFGLSATTAEP